MKFCLLDIRKNYLKDNLVTVGKNIVPNSRSYIKWHSKTILGKYQISYFLSSQTFQLN